MKREIQLILSATLCAPLYYLLIDDLKSAAISGFAILLAFLIWKYQKEIRGNATAMQIFKKIF